MVPLGFANLKAASVEPNFDDPELDIYEKIARTTDSDTATMRATLSETDLLLPVEIWDVPGTMYDTEDVLFFYKKKRSKKYAGPNGQQKHNCDVIDVCKRKSDYLYKERPTAWSLIERYIGTRVEAQVKIPSVEYNTHLADIDYMWLWKKVKFVFTGQGAYSIFLLIAKLLNLKMTNNNYVPFHESY